MKDIIRLVFLLTLFVGMFFAMYGQEVSGTLKFDEDSIDLGRPTRIWVKVTHPERTVVVFPDSAGDFNNWEIASSQAFPTKTHDGISTDRKAYMLRSFSIDPVQKLQLPFRFLVDQDTVLRFTDEDSVYFRPRIVEIPDTIVWKMYGGLTGISDPPNYLLWFAIFLAVDLVLVVLILIFYKPFLRWMSGRKVDKEWNAVTRRLKEAGGLLPQPAAFMQEINAIWKHYLDPEKRLSLASLSTTELQSILGNLEALEESERQQLLELNRSADTVLYAGLNLPPEQLSAWPEKLLPMLKKEFERRKGAAGK